MNNGSIYNYKDIYFSRLRNFVKVSSVLHGSRFSVGSQETLCSVHFATWPKGLRAIPDWVRFINLRGRAAEYERGEKVNSIEKLADAGWRPARRATFEGDV
uniref:Uncharacterized protein n=1 Tax=Vespula pensylvanica TaxID=30213 RepID=A0A834P688_VESPE|nr:hypothetical protein H0235_006110 [Vespula pensylvanica]